MLKLTQELHCNGVVYAKGAEVAESDLGLDDAQLAALIGCGTAEVMPEAEEAEEAPADPAPTKPAKGKSDGAA